MENKNTSEIMIMLNMSKDITQKKIEKFLNQKKIAFSNIEFIDVDDQTRNTITLTDLDMLKCQTFPDYKDQIMRIQFFNSSNELVKMPKPINNEIISYDLEYEKILIEQYERKLGTEGLKYLDYNVIEKQRSVAGYLIKTVGMNLIQGKSIMNVSLPINIFDNRSILELFAWQNAYASTLLEKAGKLNSSLEKIKYTTAFAITRFHLSGSQLKPFNPILGETFQCKILESNFYMEQTCHHPPILNFYVSGKNYKIYGYNESEASTGPNSVKVLYKGNMVVEYPDGTKNIIIYPDMKLEGTMIGSRLLMFRGKLFIIDEANDLIVNLELDPDERGFLKKLVSGKQTYPDYIRGLITNISKNAKFDKKDKAWNIINANKHKVCSIEGEFTSYLKFDNQVYWEYKKDSFPKFLRMAYTLPSDSTFREDLNLLKKDEEASQRYKIKLEEIQRNDRKLRDTYLKNKK